jgi:hypothetical protein
MRVRLRPAYSPEELAVLYPEPHDHTRWADHLARVEETIKVALELYQTAGGIVADLSCGDAATPRAVASERGAELILGDFAPGYEITGPIEQTISLVAHADLFTCCETVEHLDDPDAVLKLIRDRAARLVLSTPLGETTPANPEHYWGWDEKGAGDMLAAAGWHPVIYRDLQCPAQGVAYQIWGCT